MADLNKGDLVAAIAAEAGISQKDAGAALDALFAVVSKTVAKGGKVAITGWLSFEQTSRAARVGRNPQTGESIKIAASKSVKVSAGSKLKAAVK